MNNYIFDKGVEIYKCKAKGSEINAAAVYLSNVLKDFSVVNLQNNGLYVYVNEFLVEYYWWYFRYS